MQASIDAVRVAGTPEGPVPVVVLAVEDEDDVVPIFIGFNEATSIARGLEADDIGRPLTHDLLLDVMEELGSRIDRVVINEIEQREDGQGGTYIADLHVQTPRGETVIDARPSDSLALAARTNASIEVTEDVFADGRDESEKFEQLEDIRNVSGDM
ncbi:bifunctional nuclease family protein [Haloterrigena sp. SYSU A121-1]|uniref:Bifunctional nuclease family protein n=1 Tax=Haloterrigena gelatinilytica TaxID=2741724 RepID=A0A8J8GIJ6_9EURY|nr:bifunctional nuclease family protein [Haloterrigena gelatinilytica]NUB89850.1 bifunctional nuclease family protein [Haloterrigena gelatinilytica]